MNGIMAFLVPSDDSLLLGKGRKGTPWTKEFLYSFVFTGKNESQSMKRSFEAQEKQSVTSQDSDVQYNDCKISRPSVKTK